MERFKKMTLVCYYIFLLKHLLDSFENIGLKSMNMYLLDLKRVFKKSNFYVEYT